MGRNDEAIKRLTSLETSIGSSLSHSLIAVSARTERATLLRQRGDLAQAQQTLTSALELATSLKSSDATLKPMVTLRGLLSRAVGDLDQARVSLREAVEIDERLQQNPIYLARDLNNLALVEWDQGNFSQAEQLLNRSLALKRSASAQPVDIAATLGNLALISLPIGRTTEAQTLNDEAVAIHRRYRSSLLGDVLTTAGRIAAERRDFASATERYREAEAVYAEFPPEPTSLGWLFYFRAEMLVEVRDLVAAEKAANLAVSTLMKNGSEGREVGFAMHLRGEIHLVRQHLTAAQRDFDTAIRVRQRYSPDSALLAASLFGAGRVAHAQQNPERARDHYCAAVRSLELQRWRWTQERDDLLELGASNAQIYRACAGGLLDKGDVAGAFDVLEQSRARLLLDRMAQHRDELKSQLSLELTTRWKSTASVGGELVHGESSSSAPSLDRGLRESSPVQAALLLGNSTKWNALKAQLPPRTALVTFLEKDNTWWTIVARAGAEVPEFV